MNQSIRQIGLALLAALTVFVLIPGPSAAEVDESLLGQDFLTPPKEREPEPAERIPGHYIVVFEDSVAQPAVVAEAQAESRDGELGFVYRSAIKGYSVADLSSADVEALRSDPRVARVEPDHLVGIEAQTVPTGVSRISALENKAIDIDGADDIRVDADVAVIDTGVYPSHIDLNVYKRMNCVPAGEDPEGEWEVKSCTDNAGEDGHGHGTHVAGTIGAIDNGFGVVGTAPGSRIWSYRALNNKGAGAESWIVAAVDRVTATREDETSANDVEVANMSLGCVCPLPLLDQAIQQSAETGVVFAIAAGNSSRDVNGVSPAGNPAAITVSALADYDGKAGGEGKAACSPASGADDTLAAFSNFGSNVDIAAPGVCIYSSIPSENKYDYLSGTSMAAPHVAGAAAVLASQSHPDSLADVKALRQELIDKGTLDWIDTSGDTHYEPLLNMGAPRLSAATLKPTDVDSGERTATLRGMVNPGGTNATYSFEYGTTKEYGNVVPAAPKSIGSELKSISVSETISGLIQDQEYHYRIVASNGTKTVYGQDRTLTIGSWILEELPDTGTGYLWGATCTSKSHCVVVGEDGSWPSVTGLVERFNGTSWEVQSPAKPSGALLSRFEGVSCSATNACTAVGEYENSSGALVHLAERWDGTAWTIQSVPMPAGAIESNLQDVSCTSATSCVAVGAYRTSPEGDQSGFAAHWDGSKWTLQLTNRKVGFIQRDRISCTSANACTVVRRGGNGNAPTVERWNGTSWQVQEPEWPLRFGKPAFEFQLHGVSCVSSTDCTAVGFAYGPGQEALIERWDGSKWQIQTIPQPKSSSGFDLPGLNNVTCTSAAGCMAVGHNNQERFAEHWNGSAWSAQLMDNSGQANRAHDVACVDAGAKICIAVGRTDSYPSVISRKPVPVVTTQPASYTNTFEPQLNGIVDPEGFKTNYYFEYGLTTAYGEKAPVTAGEIEAGAEPTAVSATLSGLKLSSTYHFRVVAENEAGISRGKDQSFMTIAPCKGPEQTCSWSLNSTPNAMQTTAESKSEAVSCASSTMCVGVGNDLYSGKAFGQIWNGSEWKALFGEVPAKLYGIKCVSTSLCLVVGEAEGMAKIEKWQLSGGNWSRNTLVLSNPSGATETVLRDVSCSSESACTAVGSYMKEGTRRTLAARWTGGISWTQQTTVDPKSGSAELLGVSCDGASSCTAVGKQEGSAPFLQRWNGTSWSLSSAPTPEGASESRLEKVSCTSASFCLAAGSYKQELSRWAFSARWNGTSWSIQSTPKPAGAKSSSLLGISCSSPSACSSVGRYATASTSGDFIVTEEKTLVESWGGSEWQVQTSPNPEGKKLARLTSVSCTASNACTAVGWAKKSSTEAETVTVGERWNGTSWSLNSTPNAMQTTAESKSEAVSCASSTMCVGVGNDLYSGKAFGQIWNGSEWKALFGEVPAKLYGIKCVSTSLCLVVGEAEGMAKIEKWQLSGGNWSRNTLVLSNPSGATETVLRDVSCSSESACTAVGSYMKEGTRRTLAARWTGGISWTQQTTVDPKSGSAELLGVSCDGASSCTAVGKQEGSAPFLQRWNGTSWSLSSAPTPEGASESRLEKVSCTSASFCLAAGSYKQELSRWAFSARWNGTSWSIQSTPKPAGAKSSSLLGISCSSPSACSSVGRYATASTSGDFIVTEEKTLVESWGGSEWQVQTSPNPEGKKLARLTSVSCTASNACTAVGWAKKSSTEAETVTVGERYG